MNANDTILVYFSATNRTKNVAEIIAKKLGVKSVSLEPQKPYTPQDLDYNNPKARVYVELQTRPNVALKNALISDWQSYKNVIIGYLVWWYDYAWAMNEFLTSNDFNGKNIAVFATSASS
ncbi:flavodoxin [Campylobacter mucosalis]|uniref:flavodoxin n=1 Tax=Campylobacter mucosalis TaxID=202 RepID=UPI00146FD660|nr:flavodoxin [Campylobacter mucosalis]